MKKILYVVFLSSTILLQGCLFGVDNVASEKPRYTCVPSKVSSENWDCKEN